MQRYLRLKKLSLINFKGAKNVEFAPDGYNSSIFGANGTGKSTVADGYSWLLTGKNVEGNAKFDIKPLVKGVQVPKTDVVVEGTFITPDGNVLLRKECREKWTTPRGSSEERFDGNEIFHYIDNIPVKKREYQQKAAELLVDEEAFNMLTNVKGFTSLPWQKQRNTLIDLFGEVDDMAVIELNKDLAELPEILDGKSIEDYKRFAVENRKTIKKEKDFIPAKIQENERLLESFEEFDATGMDGKLKVLHNNLNSARRVKNDIITGSGIDRIDLEIKSVGLDLQAKLNDHNTKISTANQLMKSKLSSMQQNISQLDSEIKSTDRVIAAQKADIEKLVKENEKLGGEFDEVSALRPTVETECPYCKATLGQQAIEEAIRKFNLNISAKLESINKKGAENKVKIDALTKDLEKHVTQKNEYESEFAGKKSEYDEVKKQFDSDIAELTSTPVAEYERKKIEQLNKSREQLSESTAPAEQKVDEEIAQILGEIQVIETEVGEYKNSRKAIERIDELKKQEKDQAEQLEKLEHALFLIEMFTRRKCEMLEEGINEEFELVNFKLFDLQINSGIAETCEATVNGIPFISLNTAGKVHAGLDIIKTLSRAMNFHPPVFVDNRESVSDIQDLNQQVFSAYVRKSDRKLRFEFED